MLCPLIAGEIHAAAIIANRIRRMRKVYANFHRSAPQRQESFRNQHWTTPRNSVPCFNGAPPRPILARSSLIKGRWGSELQLRQKRARKIRALAPEELFSPSQNHL